MGINERQTDRSVIWALAWPCILENVTTTLVSLVDTAMVGSAGAVATAAVGACTTPTWLLNGIIRSLGIGGTALVARQIGSGDHASAHHTASQVFHVSLLISGLMSVLLFFGAALAPMLMRVSAEVLPEATAYMRILSLSFLFHYTGMCMGAVLRGAGDTRTPMVSGLIANLLNVLGNFLLIYPARNITFLGFSIPLWGAGMGVRGAAAASAFAMSAAGLYILLKMLRPASVLKISPGKINGWDVPLLRRIFKIALPAAVERIAINSGQIIFAGYIATIGTAELAAYHITTNIEALGYMPANGFQSAASALVGQNLGAGQPEKSQRLGRKTILYALAMLIGTGLGIFLLRRPLAMLFSADHAVVEVTTGMLVLCALVQPLNALTIVTVGVLNGAGDTRLPMVFSLITMWLVRIPFSLLLGFTLGFGAYGVYCSMLLDLAVRAVLLLWRFRSGKWKTIKA